MDTITVNVYQFDELSDKAKETAREWYKSDGDGDPFWHECAIEDMTISLGFLGYDLSGKRDGIAFSGFYSQGDGAQFTGTWRARDVNMAGLTEHTSEPALIRIAEALRGLAEKFPDSSATIKHSGHYSHKYCTSFDCDFLDSAEQFCEKSEKEFIELSRDAMQWVYDTLEKEYIFTQSDSSVDENIEANAYEFTIDGKRSVVL